MTEKSMIRLRIWSLKKWRKEIGDEFEKWPMFYTSKWFIDQMSQIDERIAKLEAQLL